MEINQQQPGTVVYISSDCMGRGDDGLGVLLMTNFLKTLGEFMQDVTHILLVNSGVRLACEGSDKTEMLAALEERGVEILCCTTCLNHFNIKDKLKAGKADNMITMVEVLTGARKVVAP